MEEQAIVKKLSEKFVNLLIAEIFKDQMSFEERKTRKFGRQNSKSVASSASETLSAESPQILPVLLKAEKSPLDPLQQRAFSVVPRPFVANPISLGVPFRHVAAAMTFKNKEKQVS
jgi:hypothetical protein